MSQPDADLPLDQAGRPKSRLQAGYESISIQDLPALVAFLDAAGRFRFVNNVFNYSLSRSTEQLIGSTLLELTGPQYQTVARQHIARVLWGESTSFRSSLIHADGSPREVEISFSPRRDEDGKISGFVSIALPAHRVLDKAQGALRDAFLLRLDDQARALSDPEEITQRAARLLAEHLGTDRCSYAEIDLDLEQVDVIGNYSPQLPGIIGRHSFASFGEDFRDHMTAGIPYVFRDSRDLSTGAAAAYRGLGIAAVISIPLLKDGKLVAGLAVHQKEPREWREDEIDLVRNVANRCWESLQRSRAERELRASESQFRTLADAIPNLAWMAYSDGHVFWYNRRWYDYTGTSPQDMEGWGWQSVHDPTVLPHVIERWRASIENGQSLEVVFPLRGADARFRPFLTRVEPVKGPDGRVLRWVGTSTDITAQQEAELLEKKSRETAELLNRVGPVLAAELDPQRLTEKLTDIATEAVRAEWGAYYQAVESGEGTEFELYAFSGIPRDMAPHVPIPGNIIPYFGEGQILRSDNISTDRRFRKDAKFRSGREKFISARSYLAIPVISRTGRAVGGLIFGHSGTAVFKRESEDIVAGIAAQAAIALDNAALFAEAHRSGQAILHSNEELKRLNEDLNQFAYSASHDLREPLRMVSIYTQFLHRSLNGALSEENTLFLDNILNGASRMEALIRDLLAYTQAAEQTGAPSLPTDAGEALDLALKNLSTVILETGAKVSSSPLPAVTISPVQLVQLFQNLVSNAIKYRGPAQPEIHIAATRHCGNWQFSVRDNGIGIEPQYKDQIFGIFKRLHTSEEYPGTGIGLAICQRIIQRAGGQIWVESQPGGGSTFFFTLS